MHNASFIETIDVGMFATGLHGVNQSLNAIFAAALGLTLAALCLFTLLYRWTSIWHSHIRHVITISSPDKQRYWSRNQTVWWPRLKRHLFAAPLFKTRHNRQLMLTGSHALGPIPLRFDSLLLAVYIASNIAYNLVLDWDAHGAVILAEVRGRSGELATINLIPTILFALRNNPLIPLLNVSFDTFNLFHRWCARVVIVETLVHTLAYLINQGHDGWGAIGSSLAETSSYQWGMVATGASVLILVTSFSPLRHAFYETFVNLHRLLALATLVGTYLHIERAQLPQLPILRAVIALWALELLARAYSVVHYNWSMKYGITKVMVEALPAEACRVTFRLSKAWTLRPGTHVHVYLPSISLWASHPFSVAWTETFPTLAYDTQDDSVIRPMTADAMSMHRPSSSYKSHSFGEKRPSIVAAQQETTVGAERTVSTVSLIVRARTGMTRALYQKAAASPTGQLVLTGAIEGPYGGRDSMISYGTVVLFAGGVGITHCVSYVRHIVAEYSQGTTSCQKLLLVWSVTNTEALEWVRPWMDEILRMDGRKDILRIQLFITKPRHQNEVVSNTGTVQMFPGRCSPKAILDKEFADRIGTMGVAVCGPGSLADSVRSAARGKMEHGAVDFVEEGFTY